MKLFLYYPTLIFCVLTFSPRAHALHNPDQVKMVAIEGGVALIEQPSALPFFEIETEAAPILNWALASALSLDTGLNVQHVDGKSYLVVGEHGQIGRYLIDARYIVKVTSLLLTEYFFEKGPHRIKIFSHTAFENDSFEEMYHRASATGGFIVVASEASKLANWIGGAFAPNAWNFIGHAKTQLGFVAFRDLVVLEASGRRRQPQIEFTRVKPYDRKDKARNFYKLKNADIQVSYVQKTWIRKLELQCRARGGSVLCIKSLFPIDAHNASLLHDACFYVGERFVLTPGENRYSERDVCTVLRLSVATPMKVNNPEPLFLQNGSVILPAVGGDTEGEVFENIKSALGKFILRHATAHTLGLPIKFGRNWIAIVVERHPEKSKLTLLDSRRAWDPQLFSALEKAVENALEGDILSSPRVTTHHIQPDDEIDADGFIMIENLLRHLNVGGPKMPLVMDHNDVLELRDEHRRLLQFHQEQLEGDTHLPRGDGLGLLPAIARVFEFLRHT